MIFASLVAVPPATAQTAPVGPKAPAAAAEAYGLDVDARLTSLNIGVDRGPFSRSSQECPPQVDKPNEAELVGVGPIPADGALVNNVGLLTSFAGANCTGKNGLPLASASAQAVDVRLINQAGVPLIQADVLRADSTTNCFDAPSGKSIITNLRVGTTNVPVGDQKNFAVLPQVFNPLGLQVIANEQFPTADGRGFVVNALHIYQFPGSLPAPVSPLFTGDIIVSHAMSTVNCPNGAPTTGGNNPIFIEKNADKAAARPGDTVTYTATVQNKAAQACAVNQLIDHLPTAFEFVSTSGAFGSTASTVNRPGGGQDIIIKPSGVNIPVGGSLSQTFVVTVKGDAQPGTYFNNVEILCGNLGNFVKGLDAPVTVTTDEEDEEEPPPPPPPAAKAECEDGVDNDGDGKIDFPNDPGCSSKQDDSEEDEHPRTGGESLAGLGILLLLGAYGVRRKLVVS